ncbi:MAG: hypothetical protein Pars2KO_22150 [Parasphingorhabdus sp.]
MTANLADSAVLGAPVSFFNFMPCGGIEASHTGVWRFLVEQVDRIELGRYILYVLGLHTETDFKPDFSVFESVNMHFSIDFLITWLIKLVQANG